MQPGARTPQTHLKFVFFPVDSTISQCTFKGTRGVQHGVWPPLHSFMIVRESIDIIMLKLYTF